MIGILKYKIIDMQRRMQRDISIRAPVQAHDLEDADDFVHDESTQLGAPAESSNPESIVAQCQFFHRMQGCIDRLPATAARAFVMREWFEYSTDEVCGALSISRANCNVMVFRTRSRLRESIETHAAIHPIARRRRVPSPEPALSA